VRDCDSTIYFIFELTLFRTDAPCSFEAQEVYSIDWTLREFSLFSGSLWRSWGTVSGFLQVSVLPNLSGHVITASPNCRTCAVSGGTYILGKDFKVEYNEGKQTFQISLDGIDETLSSKAIVAEPSQLPETLSTPPPAPGKLVSRCIAIIDKPIQLIAPRPSPTEDNAEPDDSAPIPEVDSSILVFPPGSLQGGGAQESVTAMITGEGSVSCPTGSCTYDQIWIHRVVNLLLWSDVIYLSATISPDQTPEEVLGPYLNATLNVNRGERESMTPVFSLFYAHPLPPALPASLSGSKRIVPIRRPSARLPEFGDAAAEEAERVFWDTIEALGLRRGATGSKEGEQDGGEDMVSSFWPPLEAEDTSATDEW